MLMSHVNVYSPILHELIDDIIKDTPNGRGPAVILQRNPSLMQGSAQLVYITKVKTNPEDTTVSMSDLIASAMNARASF